MEVRERLEERVRTLLDSEPLVSTVRLTGSRARGDPVELSDWDFLLESPDAKPLANELPGLLAPLRPVIGQWDRLAPFATYMLLLAGGIKVDFLLALPHEPEPPWQVSAASLQGVDAHFWDWTVWLAAKQTRGKNEFVRAEFDKMLVHLLQPKGVPERPAGIEAAIEVYRQARGDAEKRFGVRVDRTAEREVCAMLRRAGYDA